MERFKVLEVKNVIEEVKGHFNCTHSSYVESCVVQNLLTKEIIECDNKSDGLKNKILHFIDNGDCIVGDEFIIRD